MKFDLKSAVIGLLAGVVLVLIFGSNGAQTVAPYGYGVGWGLIVPPTSKLLVKDAKSDAFIVDVATARATRVNYDPAIKAPPGVQLTLGR
ncbi:MAG: hypothetical protein ACYSR5_06815 [Planctomycetota bacterium]|jgi:hypothetical protein